jgi:6-phosphogluconolactonase (cycloisomerase 2 family)
MKTSTALRASAALSLVLGIGLVSAGAAGADEHYAQRHALFAETDSPSANSVISYVRGDDGTISYYRTYPTFGLGAVASGATADPLASQGGLALINGGQDLVATNPGSNSISVFDVDGPRLRFLEQVPSGGLFPNSVASYGNTVAVLNAGASGAVAEFRWDDHRLIPLASQTRSLGLANTTPPFFLAGAGQVGFTPDGSHLVVTTKHSTDSFEVFSVSRFGQLGATPTITAANSPVPFAFNFDSAGNLVAVQALNSVLSTYSVNADGSLTLLGSVGESQHALCWISSSNGYFFGDNAGSGTVSSFTENATANPTLSPYAPVLLNATAATAHAGTTDSTVSPDGNYLYVESGGSGSIDVFAIGSSGTLTPVETLLDLPVASEGIVAS